MNAEINKTAFFHGVGRRKCAIACARIYEKNSKKGIIVNGLPFDEYFDVARWRDRVSQPLQITSKMEDVTVICKIIGGGKRAQADALSLGISRAIEKMDAGFRALLKSNKLLTRDSRKKERKKPGQKGARAKFQYGKR